MKETAKRKDSKNKKEFKLYSTDSFKQKNPFLITQKSFLEIILKQIKANQSNFLSDNDNNIKKTKLKENHMARVLISMPEDFLDKIDQVAEGENRTRSELIREALRTYMYKSRVKTSTIAAKNAAILDALLD